MRKLRSRAGETLAEILCAILVTGLGVALLAGMTDAAARLERKAAQTASNLYSCVTKAEDPASSESTYPTAESGTVPVELAGGATVNMKVTFYGRKDQVTAYRGTEPETTAP